MRCDGGVTMSFQFSDPTTIIEAGLRVYEKLYRSEYEAKHPGQFVAVDVASEKAYVGTSPEEALTAARRDAPNGVFHLIKVGSPGAFRVSYSSNAGPSWLHQ